MQDINRQTYCLTMFYKLKPPIRTGMHESVVESGIGKLYAQQATLYAPGYMSLS